MKSFGGLLFLLFGVTCQVFQNVSIELIENFFAKPHIVHIESSDFLASFILPNYEVVSIKRYPVEILRENSVGNITNVEFFLMCCNNLEDIEPGAFRNSNFTSINICDTKLKEIRSGVFNDGSLKYLNHIDLSSNRISSIEGTAFDNMETLIQIVLDGNLLGRWNPEWFKNTPNLSELHFENNSLVKLPSFEKLASPKRNIILRFAHNKLERIPKNAFGGLKNFDVIDFKNNSIKKIDPEAFQGVENIDWLDLEDNLLDDFAGDLSGIQLNYLLLGGNKIVCFSGDFAKILVAKNFVQLGSNLFDCQCLEKIKNVTENTRAGSFIVLDDNKC